MTSEELKSMATSEDVGIRTNAAGAFGDLESTQQHSMFPVYRKLFFDESPNVRAEAATSYALLEAEWQAKLASRMVSCCITTHL
jgi:HEAT repeat protein